MSRAHLMALTIAMAHALAPLLTRAGGGRALGGDHCKGGPAGSWPASGSPADCLEPVVGSSASARLRMASNGPPATAAISSTTTTAAMSRIATTSR
jgi:hypothetical protein